MSGIYGLVNLDGAPVMPADLACMASMVACRGPDGANVWHEGAAGVGHSLFATGPVRLAGSQPIRHEASGCVITADVRLDNADELRDRLGAEAGAALSSDAALVLAAYLAWGGACADHLLGDFAVAIWDPRTRTLWGARDRFGMRPFYYHHSPGRFFAFASRPQAILVLPRTPFRINESRVADFIVQELEGVDKVSTFFEGIYRLPPAHTLTLSPGGLRLRRYWLPEPVEPLHLPSDDAYAEAFLEAFTAAVRTRLLAGTSVGSMLSGGMDSGAVAAVGRTILADEGKGPLLTFSATSSQPGECVETRAIHSALTMDGLDPCTVHDEQLDEYQPGLDRLTWNLDEPFDLHMTLVRVLYLAARRRGVTAMLDAAAGDTLLAEGSHLPRLLRRGRWLSAYREAVGWSRFWTGRPSPWAPLIGGAASAFVPDRIRQLRRRLLAGRRAERRVRESLIDPAFARRVALADRLRALDSHRADAFAQDYQSERARAVDHPFLTVARERYDRVAAAAGIEPRDPFLDLRVVRTCLAMPGAQLLGGGWPKAVVRRAMAGRLPDPVRWRRGKEHLGWRFTSALIRRMSERMRSGIMDGVHAVLPYVDSAALDNSVRSYFEGGDARQAARVWELVHLSAWLTRYAHRPAADAGSDMFCGQGLGR